MHAFDVDWNPSANLGHNKLEFDFRYDCDVSQQIAAIKLINRDEIINGLALHSILSVKAELGQILSGLNT